ncbi:phage portal protein, partial [Lactobacillus sp. XV13L]|nr:phage portal protein [Lactobacillus sp. XV13L]
MAADLDQQAKVQSIEMLNGHRWGGDNTLDEANKTYMMPTEKWEQIKNDSYQIGETVKWFIDHHYRYQLPRIIELER